MMKLLEYQPVKKTKSKRGRKTLFRNEIIKESERMAGLGMIESQIAYVFGVSPFTLSRWKGKHPEFQQALKRGECTATQHVQAALFQSACGYRTSCKKAFLVKDGRDRSHVEIAEEEVVFQPNPKSIIYWLNNKAPEVWREISEVKGAGTNVNVNVSPSKTIVFRDLNEGETQADFRKLHESQSTKGSRA